MTQELSKSILTGILQETFDRVGRGESQVIVFDLDSTLFEVTPRSQQILQEFIDSHHFEDLHEMKSALQTVRLQSSDHGLESAVRRAGIEFRNEELRQQLIQFWRERFFSNEYLTLDRPFEGAVEFVQELYRRGAHIKYLTGRDRVRMGEGTPRQLQTWQFPVHMERTELIMKPVKGLDDSEFKLEEIKRLGNVTWFFENEPKIIRRVESELPNLNIVFFRSSHSGKAEPREEWLSIHHFKR